MAEEKDDRFDSAARSICERLREPLLALPGGVKKQVQEIRLRIGRPVCLCCAEGMFFPGPGGRMTLKPEAETLAADRRDLEESFRNLCGYSVYSHENEIRNGYITLSGGHRAGICGTAVLQDGTVCGMRDISSINLRVSREIRGAADTLLDELGKRIDRGLLLAGAPSSGKTTILRDLARQLSGGVRGRFRKVAVIDERSEIAGSYLGEPQNDLGCCCDVLDGYPKAEGILIALRCLSPEIILCDEIGSEHEADAVEQGLNAGVAVIASIHAADAAELMKRRQAQRLLRAGAFGSVALLDASRGPGHIAGIYKAGDLLAEAGGKSSPDCRGGSFGLFGIA